MSESGRAAVRFEKADIVFGDAPERAFALIDRGASRQRIREETGQVLGAARATLEVLEGETLVLMGLSGSGKSTLLRAVNALNPLARGKVEIRCPGEGPGEGEWRNPHLCSAAQLRQLRLDWVSMVFQQFALLPWRTVAENVGLGLELAGLGRGEIERRVDEQLEMVGLSEWKAKRVHELSGGMQQRVGLARAFATQAPILLMDEPYSALDPLIRSRLQDELLDLRKRLKRTIIFVSHDLDEAIRIGTRIAIMQDGAIVQCGTASEILNRPANEYVADFVAHMNPLSVCSARDAMRSASRKREGEADCPVADETAPLREVMRTQLESGKAVYVGTEQSIVGRIDSSDIHRLLLRRREAEPKGSAS